MINRHHILRALGVKGLDAAARKRRGGDADADGDGFEAQFALTEILRLSHLCKRGMKDPHCIWLGAQVDGFVDDFFIDDNGSQTFCELKSSPTQSWTTRLRLNFLRQRKILRVNNLQADLALIVSNAELAEKMMSNARGGVRHVSVRSFRMDWGWIHRSVRSFVDRWADEHEVTGFQNILIAIWRGRHPLRSLSCIHEEWHKQTGARIAVVDKADSSEDLVSEELKDVLESITDMTFYPKVAPIRFIHHDLIGDCTGYIPIVPEAPVWAELEHALLNAKPTCYIDFRVILIEFLEREPRHHEVI